jgi:two-component system CheB/CheR fusion protein
MRSEWQSQLEKIQSGIESAASLTNVIKTEKESLTIEWHICAVTDNENKIGGFEMLGVLLKKTVLKSSDQNQLSANQGSKLKLLLFKLKKILDSSQDVICVVNEKGKFTKVSAASKEVFGYEPRELVGRNFMDLVYKEDIERTLEADIKVKSGIGTTNFENRYYKKDGSLAHLVWSSRWDDGDKRYYAIARNAEEKKASEAALKASEEKYKLLFYNHALPSWIYDTDTFMFLEVNEAAIQHYGYSRSEFLDMKLTDILVGKEVDRFKSLHNQSGYYLLTHKGLWIHHKKNNELMYSEITSNYIKYEGRNAKLVLSIDRTEQTIAERKLIESNEKYISLSEATFDAIWDWNIETGDMQWNSGVKKMFEMPDLSTLTKVEWWLGNLHSDDRERVEEKLFGLMSSKTSNWEDEYRFRIADESYKYIYARGYIIFDSEKPVRMIGAMQDLTERKAHENMLQKLNNSLEKRARELAESNAELERFAYVASHDLQEPLRMVTSFLQLLEKRYKNQLDQKAHEYSGYAVDGAERMKRLILDLLEYSRVNSSKLEKDDVDVNEVVEDLKITYKSILLETSGALNYKPLPIVKGNKTQILQLFQNLVGNAFKYKSEVSPEINISYEEDNLNYTFSVSDNGIGIDPKFFTKIFIIFQRLHNREEYSGTGIGLAICKKIIDKHGGKIWVTSETGRGSTFYFTLPKSK